MHIGTRSRIKHACADTLKRRPNSNNSNNNNNNNIIYARERTVRHIRANALKYLHDNESETVVHKWNPRRDCIRILCTAAVCSRVI